VAANDKIKQWPADSVERRPTDSLIPYARNSRTHSPEQVSQLAASMKEWGFTNPVLVDEQGGIIAGHGRVMAAKKLGFKEVPVMVAKGWTEAQKKAYLIYDNKSALDSSWNQDFLLIEMQDLQDLGFDLALTGFSVDELASLLVEGDDIESSGAGSGNEDTLTVSKEGNVWILGEQRLTCGSKYLKDADSIAMFWQELSGKVAVLESTGQSFADVLASNKGVANA
jgi:ParB-like chromosome segregation protein Spo0J